MRASSSLARQGVLQLMKYRPLSSLPQAHAALRTGFLETGEISAALALSVLTGSQAEDSRYRTGL